MSAAGVPAGDSEAGYHLVAAMAKQGRELFVVRWEGGAATLVGRTPPLERRLGALSSGCRPVSAGRLARVRLFLALIFVL